MRPHHGRHQGQSQPGAWSPPTGLESKKRSTTRTRSARGIPGPVSVTDTSTSPDERRLRRSVIAPPDGVYFMELSNKFDTACVMNSRCPRMRISGEISASNARPLSSQEGPYNSATSLITSETFSCDLSSASTSLPSRDIVSTVEKVRSTLSRSSIACCRTASGRVRPDSKLQL